MDVGGRFGLVRDRFEGWRKYLKLWPADAAEADPYARVSYLIAAFNENRKEKVSPGTGVCIDESMGKWMPFFKDTPEGIPNLTKLIRKPVGVGAEYKCMADAWTGIMLFLEYQEGKDRMQLKKWCDQYPKHVALVLRLTEMLHGKGHIVYGDSYFTSVQTVKALLEQGTYYLGMLKTASAGFPKKYLQSLAWNDDATRGETRRVQHTVNIKGVQEIIFGHAWNEPGIVGLPKTILCGSAHHTLSTDPHVKVRWQLNVVTGSSEQITRTVPRTSAVKEYFQAACIIDVQTI